MHYKHDDFKHNKLETKEDVQNLVIQMCEPLKAFYSEGNADLNIGNIMSHNTKLATTVETFARPLWGIVPLLAGGCNYDILDIYINGIKNGTNPNHPEYWGIIGDGDQRMVEMAEIALALILIPEKIWLPLNDTEKQNLSKWLYQINCFNVNASNWKFFNVIVNVGLKSLGENYDKEIMENSISVLDSFYVGNGWYTDGKCDRLDYYIPMAFHYYALIYAKVMENDDKVRSDLYKERARLFTNDFIYWFSTEGSAIPFGRSLIYRFAQGAFWGALAFANVESLPWGVIKGIYLRHLRWWMTQPIFDNAGILSVGYSYENMLMTEYYNASGSTYWGMKIFLPLALDENHPFWKSKEEPLPTLSNIYLQKEPRMVLSRNEEQNHIIAFTSGQSWDPENANNFAKYGKFAYSTVFGFSVSKGGYGLELGAYDSTIAVSRGDEYYRSRDVLEDYSVSTDFLYSEWKPWEDVDVKSWIIPGNPWHVRIHKIETKEALHIADGGFAIKRSENIKNLTEGIDMFSENEGTIIKYPWASSGAINLYGNSDFEIIRPEPCTNLLNPRTYIPTLKSEINAGTTILISGFFGGYTQSDMLKWNNKPNVDIHDKLIVVETENGKVEIEI